MSLLIIACTFIVAFSLGRRSHRSQTARDLATLAWFKATFLRKQGWCIGRGNYDLQSFDGGKRWYAVEPNRTDDAVVILGPAEDVHPGLIAQLDGMDRLVKHVRASGPLTLSGPTADVDRALLEGAGIAVVPAGKS